VRRRRSLILSVMTSRSRAFSALGCCLGCYQVHRNRTCPSRRKFSVISFCTRCRLVCAGCCWRNLRHRYGLAQHRDQRARDQFHSRLVSALHQSGGNRGAKSAHCSLGDDRLFPCS
jgi:hypothetical protein